MRRGCTHRTLIVVLLVQLCVSTAQKGFLGDSFSHLRYVLKDDDLYSFAAKHTKRIVEGAPDIVRLCE